MSLSQKKQELERNPSIKAYEEAISAFPCAQLQSDFLFYLISNGNSIDIKRLVAGIVRDYLNSHLVFDQFMEYELSFLDVEDMEDDDQEALQERTDRINYCRKEFLARLRVPHATIDATFQNYCEFEGRFGPSDNEMELKEASKTVWETKQRYAYKESIEQELQNSDALDTWLNCIHVEKRNGTIHDVVGLFQRALLAFPFEILLWRAQCKYLACHDYDLDYTLLATKQALGRFKTDAGLWRLGLFLAHKKGPTAAVEQLFTDAFSAVASVRDCNQLIQLTAYKLSLSNPDSVESEFKKLSKLLNPVLKKFRFRDREMLLNRTMALVAARAGEIEKARAMYSSMAKKESKFNAEFWQEYLELVPNDEKRNIYSSCLRRTYGDRSVLYKGWKCFESAWGTAESIIKADCIIWEFQQEDLYNQTVRDPVELESKKRKADEELEDESKKTKLEPNERKPRIKLNRADAEKAILLKPVVPILSDSVLHACKEYGIVRDFDIVDVEGSQGYYIEFSTSQEAKQFPSLEIEGNEFQVFCCEPKSWLFPTTKAQNTVFIKNLAPSTTKLDLRKHLETGQILDIRLIQKPKFSFAYIEYAKEEFAAKAVELSETVINGNTVLIAISDPEKKKKVERDDRNLFIGNVSCGQDRLAHIFSQFGEISSIRLIKNAAFVNFDDVEAAKQALTLNNTEIDGRIINVSVAEVREKKFEKKKSFVPRQAVPQTAKGRKNKIAIKGHEKKIESEQTANDLTQDDFRKMFLTNKAN